MNFGVSRRVGRGTWVRANTGHLGHSRSATQKNASAIDGFGMLFLLFLAISGTWLVIEALASVWFLTIPCIALVVIAVTWKWLDTKKNLPAGPCRHRRRLVAPGQTQPMQIQGDGGSVFEICADCRDEHGRMVPIRV